MFAGLIQSIGRVRSLSRKSDGYLLLVEDDYIYSNVKEGDSVSVDGACLTVRSIENDIVGFDVSVETFRRTIIGEYKSRRSVNMELALMSGSRIGGHIITGHIDTKGNVLEYSKRGDYIYFCVGFDRSFSSLVVEKGSIAINGVSLTINEVQDGEISVLLIPHTIQNTNLELLNAGDRVNIEFDLLGKYVVRYLLKKENGDERLKRLLEED